MSRRDIQERSFRFACAVVRLCEELDAPGARRRLLAQLLAAGTSAGANLEEAPAAQSKPDFISKCSIALKEARESHYWLRLIVASYASARPLAEPLLTEADELVAILTTIVKRARQQRSPTQGPTAGP